MALGIMGVIAIVDIAVKVLGTLTAGAGGTPPSVSQVVRVIDILFKNNFLSTLDFKNNPFDAVEKVLAAIKNIKRSLKLGNDSSLDQATAEKLIAEADNCLGESHDATNSIGPTSERGDEMVAPVELIDGVDFFYWVDGNLPVVRRGDGTSDPDLAKSLIERAMLAWQLVACIRFRRASVPAHKEKANIVIGDAAIDGSGGVIGLGDVGTGRGDNRGLKLVFDRGEADWDAEKFFLTACHELGHCLGLRHEDGSSQDDLMHPILSKVLPAELMAAIAENDSNSDEALVTLVNSGRLFSARDKERISSFWVGDIPLLEEIAALWDPTSPGTIVFRR